MATKYIQEQPYDSRKAARQYHIEVLGFDPVETARTGEKRGKERHLLFDYSRRNPLNADARVEEVLA